MPGPCESAYRLCACCSGSIGSSRTRVPASVCRSGGRASCRGSTTRPIGRVLTILLPVQKAADAIDRTLDVLHRVGIGEADVALALVAEAGAGDQRDADLVQEVVLQLARVE